MNAQEALAHFPCPDCGGQMVFDTESQKMKCMYCSNESAIDNSGEAPIEHELDFHGDSDASLTDWGTEQQVIHCENCGGEILLPIQQTATACPFCGSAKVLPQGSPNSIRPESVIPFHISKEEATTAFHAWKRKKWFLPNNFKKRNTNSSLNGVYIPFWTFDSYTASSYTAEVGVYHYRTETRTRVVDGKTETYTETVKYTVWHWTNGDYEREFDDILIPASAKHETKLLEKFNDFDLNQLVSYKPEFLSGFIAERYSVSLQDGWTYAKNRINDTLESEIKAEIGGDEIRNLSISTRYSDRTYKHILLPIWTATYSYNGKTYRYMVNGETGSVSGHVPRSALKITLFALICLGLAGLAIYLFMYYQN